MRKVALVILISLFFYSCTKKSTSVTTTSSITATVDGVNTTFNVHAVAQKISNGGAFDISIEGYDGSTSNSNAIGISITSQSEIVTGTYSTNGNVNATSAGGVSYIGKGSDYYITTGAPESQGTVTVTSVSNTSIEGTFSGAVELITTSGTSTNIKNITKGHFKLNF